MPTAGHPVVYGEWLKAGNEVTTVLIYGHYDVQPSEPNELWKPNHSRRRSRARNVRPGRIRYERSGNCFVKRNRINYPSKDLYRLTLSSSSRGKKKSVSPPYPLLKEHKDLLASDVALNPDAGMIVADIPTIVYGLRGLAYFELRVYGPDTDLHSGLYGGVVHNPAQALCELIAGMHDEQGRVTLPGFYDRVRPVEIEERQELARLPMNESCSTKSHQVFLRYGVKRTLPQQKNRRPPDVGSERTAVWLHG